MFARYREALDRGLRTTFGDARLRANEIGGSDLWKMLEYHMGWSNEDGSALTTAGSQGKALRPTVCLFACDALGGDWGKALPAASALEFIHNFSLIHDDIQDEDRERRHRPTVWALWGRSQALVAGNALRTAADLSALELVEAGVSEERALRASSLLVQGYLEMIRGQCMDLAFERSVDIGLDEYLEMISLKTGALIRCGMEMGAIAATDDESSIRSFARSGSLLGLAFQITDDVLGVWGDETATGKSVGNDLRRRKKSFPMVYALSIASDGAKDELLRRYDKPELDEEDVAEVLGLLEDLDVPARAGAIAREKADLALREMEGVPLPDWARKDIGDLAEFLTARSF